MTSKTIIIGLVAIAFVAGSIMTGTMASAAKGGAGDNLITDALNSIATAISGIEPTVNVDPTPVDIVVNAPQGPQGEQGPPGTFTSVQTVKGSLTTLAPLPVFWELTATCPAGTFPISSSWENGIFGSSSKIIVMKNILTNTGSMIKITGVVGNPEMRAVVNCGS